MKKVKTLVLGLAASLVLMSSSMVFAAGDEYKFGNGAQDVSTQGKNGWYYMYGTDHNKNGSFNTAALKQCVIGGDAMYSYSTGTGWIPDAAAIKAFQDKDPGNKSQLWFYIADDGSVVPGMDCTAALKWVAQQDGTYKVTATYTGGARMKDAGDIADGVSFSIYSGTTKLAGQNSGKNHISKTVTSTVNLKSGAPLYFISDPNADWGTDEANWSIDIVRTGDLPAGTTTSTTSTSTTVSSNPKTGDPGVAIPLVLLLASGSGLGVLALKRK